MKFISAQPNLYVKISNKYIQRVTGKKGFYFDANGEFETNNKVLIAALNPLFRVVETIEESDTESTVTEETAEVISEQITKEVVEIKFKKCKKCNFETDNSGALMSHYRLEHPKN